MFEKIPLNRFFVANFVDEKIEYVYGGLNRSIKVIHHFDVIKEKSLFMIVIDSSNQIIGYMNLADNIIYQPINYIKEDYEESFDTLPNIDPKQNDGFIGFEPLSNYNSKFIKPVMSLKEAKKTLIDINKQIKTDKQKILIR